MLVVMVGLPGSGKTTYARASFRNVISPDEIRLNEFDTAFDRKLEPQVWRRAYARVRDALARGEVVCFDATSVTETRRRALLRIAAEYKVPAVAVWMRVPPELAWERNRTRGRHVPRPAFLRMLRALQPPSPEEGFVAVIEVDGAAPP